MKREGLDLIVISVVVALGLSLYAGRMTQAAVTLPPEAKPLQRHLYKKLNTCANVEPFVKHQVKLWWNRDKSITPKLLKLLYADCMVNVSFNDLPSPKHTHTPTHFIFFFFLWTFFYYKICQYLCGWWYIIRADYSMIREYSFVSFNFSLLKYYSLHVFF